MLPLLLEKNEKTVCQQKSVSLSGIPCWASGIPAIANPSASRDRIDRNFSQSMEENICLRLSPGLIVLTSPNPSVCDK